MMITILEEASNGINRILSSVAWLLLGLEIIVVFAQIVIRLSRIQFVGISEISSLLFIWITFLGSTIALKEGLHISITTLETFMSATLKRICSSFSLIASFAFSLILTTKGFEVTKVAMLQTSPGLGISFGWFYGVIPVSGMIMAIHSLALLSESMTDFKKQLMSKVERGKLS